MVSVVVVSWLSCSLACGIFPDQESNLCFLHWPLSHQGGPLLLFLKTIKRNMTVLIALDGIPKIKNEWNLNLLDLIVHILFLSPQKGERKSRKKWAEGG